VFQGGIFTIVAFLSSVMEATGCDHRRFPLQLYEAARTATPGARNLRRSVELQNICG
jgi:hypothetical protein